MADNLQNQKAPSQADMGVPSGSQVSAEEAAKRNSEQEVMKNSILTQVLNQDARARLNNLAAVKPEKAKAVENMIIQMARMGQIREKLSDERFRQLLDQISEKTTKTTTVKFDRRRAAIDSDSE
uniref:Programmed cell death protein 5 n=1 Tax=Ditylenchus dipsaci TaxID=166011 RepID=A0A915E770_9BILA